MSIFTEVLTEKPSRSTFNVSHSHLTSGNMGKLIPIYCDFVNPNEYFEITPYSLVKLQPLVFPVMGNIRVDIHFFYVPKRLVWQGWNDFITGKADLEHPYLNLTTNIAHLNTQPANGSVADYLGLPQGTTGFDTLTPIDPSELAVYNLIWNEYYRDQNITDELVTELVEGNQFPNNQASDSPDLYANLKICRNRAWQHDYFTSCLPYAQKGTAVLMPLTQNEQIDVIMTDKNASIDIYKANGTLPTGSKPLQTGVTGVTIGMVEQGTMDRLKFDPDGTLAVELNEQAVTISTFRTSLALQSYLEQLARGGQRINEYIKSMYGIQISDLRAQRPEFIGSSSSLVQVSEILSTAASSEQPLAMFAGNANGANKGEKFTYRIEEHGYIMGLLSVLPDTMYMNGLHRKWERLDKLDYFLPQFENIGEQAVYKKEINYASSQKNEIFGYIPRNAEYKFTNNIITGDMKRSLAQFHFGRNIPDIFGLNASFIYAEPTKEPFAVISEDEHCLIIQTYLDIKATRPMQRFANPKLI